MRKLLIVFLILFTYAQALAQETKYYSDPEKKFLDAKELFSKEKYGAARDLFQSIVKESGSYSMNVLDASQYYLALCAFELFHADAEPLLRYYIQFYPLSVYTKHAYFVLGNYYFRTKLYKYASDAYDKTDVLQLTNEEITEYYFRNGYSKLIKKDYNAASKNFKEVLDVESKYQTAANFYYAHLAYANNNLNTALSSFQKLSDSETFGPLIPYYIVQIYFELGKYDSLVKYAEPKLKVSGVHNKTEIMRIVAESYFRLKNYDLALERFDEYQKAVPVLSRDDKYALGFLYYRKQKYDEAVALLEQVVGVDDKLSQYAYYHLADSYLKQGKKQNARNAFQSASIFSFDDNIKENALFSYAKISYELGFHSVAVSSMRDFQSFYPNSTLKHEASEVIANAYLSTRNYKEALETLEEIKDKSPTAKKAYQKVAYYRAVELYNDGNKDKSIGLFERAIINDVDQDIRAQAIYWKAEVLYAQEKFDAALKQFRIFLFNPGSVRLSYFNRANYCIAYCHFKLEDYAEAQTWFRKYVKTKDQTETSKYNDALIRIGDAQFILKNYDQAFDFYQQAVAAKASGSDYCIFQNGIINGIQKKLQDKIQAMNKIITQYPSSAYLDDAIFEKGNTLLVLGKENDAQKEFLRIINEHPNSSYHKKALLKMALAYYNSDDNSNALKYYKQVVEKYPGTSEAMEALTGIKNIYIEQGNPQAYFDYAQNIPNANVSMGAQDSITYEAAEQSYLSQNANAASDLQNYINKFPNGIFILNAMFYKAELDFSNKNYTQALSGYEAIASKSKNLFTERSLLKAAYIHVLNNNCQAAIGHYLKLELAADYFENLQSAQQGLMLCYYNTNNCEQSRVYANKLINNGKTPKELINEAQLYTGRCALKTSDWMNADKAFKTLAKLNSVIGAEAMYQIAYIQYELKNYKESQKKAYELINQLPSYDYWIAKAFILLADNYVALKDNFQAKHTLQSVIDNYNRSADDPEDIRAIAQAKLDSILQGENQRLLQDEQKQLNQQAAQDSIDIDLNKTKNK